MQGREGRGFSSILTIQYLTFALMVIYPIIKVVMQNKHWIGVGVISLVIVGMVGGFFVWHSKQNESVSLGAASNNVPAETEASSGANSAGSLSASSNSAQNLGQINPTSTKTSSQSGSGGSSGSSDSQGIDPSKFGEYDKYKAESKVLFGDLKAGDGATAADGQTATVVYKGWLTNGQLFDQSKTNAEGKLEAFQFKIGAGQVIAGWEQGITGMKVGGVRLLVVPPAVGYGTTDHGPIPANSVLVFQVQLVDVK